MESFLNHLTLIRVTFIVDPVNFLNFIESSGHYSINVKIKGIFAFFRVKNDFFVNKESLEHINVFRRIFFASAIF